MVKEFSQLIKIKKERINAQELYIIVIILLLIVSNVCNCGKLIKLWNNYDLPKHIEVAYFPPPEFDPELFPTNK